DPLLVPRRVQVAGRPLAARGPPRADLDLDAGEHAVPVPVVDLEGARAAAPLRPRDHAIVVGVHGLEPDLRLAPAPAAPLGVEAATDETDRPDRHEKSRNW